MNLMGRQERPVFRLLVQRPLPLPPLADGVDDCLFFYLNKDRDAIVI